MTETWKKEFYLLLAVAAVGLVELEMFQKRSVREIVQERLDRFHAEESAQNPYYTELKRIDPKLAFTAGKTVTLKNWGYPHVFYLRVLRGKLGEPDAPCKTVLLWANPEPPETHHLPPVLQHSDCG